MYNMEVLLVQSMCYRGSILSLHRRTSQIFMASGTKYKPLQVSEEDHNAPGTISSWPRAATTWQRLGLLFTALLVILLTVVVRFLLGRHTQQQPRSDLDWFWPPDDVRVKYQYHREFTARPDNHTKDPWMSIIPASDGFIKHPTISPIPHGVAVFHQLHCLNAIRLAYWAAVDGTSNSHMSRPAHVRHCIDYIRQALMCHADTNLEPIEEDVGGATGWASEHKCRDFARLRDWVGQWVFVVPES
ncbi:hypothetical protein GGR54DRAFT_324394 [Hypoxylon sp. NC1633]|nr:hypothetical protein GGR54DRAFT_324394 [Hypoxylon sp. NC1633]